MPRRPTSPVAPHPEDSPQACTSKSYPLADERRVAPAGLATASAVADAATTDQPALIHDETATNEVFVYGLATMDYPVFPLPMGVLRAVDQPTFEDRIEQQIDAARHEHGPGDLEALLDAGECWTVD